MNWYYIILGGHTHVRVFMNGGKCGDLCFRNDEFQQIKCCVEMQTPVIHEKNEVNPVPLITLIEEKSKDATI